jgi:PAS domain S-box-containing protein
VKPPVSEQLLQKIADSVPAVVALFSPVTGEYLYVNQASARILGYAPDEIREGGLAFLAQIVHPEDLARVMRENQEAIERANRAKGTEEEVVASFEYRMRHKDGEWRWLHTDGTVFERDEHGKVSLILNVSLDITAQKKAEIQLTHSLKALERALNV